jgi:diketogulonate reductase-like aldo/keto reductase
MNKDNFLDSAYGVRMPKLIYGTAWKKERTASLVEQALESGFRGIDTACQPKHYFEAGVGTGIKACLDKGLKRSDLYLQSKFTSLNGQDPQQVPYDPNASLAAQVQQSFQVSLNNLQTSYLDCLILHSPMADRQQTLEVWQAMSRIYQDGDVKQLGISNCYDLSSLQDLFNFSEIKPAVVQNRFYADTRYDRNIRDFCQQQGVIYQSFWTLTANPRILAHELVAKLASLYSRKPAQVFFRFLTQLGIVPLTGTTSKIHMQEDLAIFDFELSDDECRALDALL